MNTNFNKECKAAALSAFCIVLLLLAAFHIEAVGMNVLSTVLILIALPLAYSSKVMWDKATE